MKASAQKLDFYLLNHSNVKARIYPDGSRAVVQLDGLDLSRPLFIHDLFCIKDMYETLHLAAREMESLQGDVTVNEA
jgi:hypothetical protein